MGIPINCGCCCWHILEILNSSLPFRQTVFVFYVPLPLLFLIKLPDLAHPASGNEKLLFYWTVITWMNCDKMDTKFQYYFPNDASSRNKNQIYYSQTGCSFDGNFANFRRNIGILVDSLRRASCNRREQVAQFIWYLVTELVEIFQNVSSVTSILWRQVCEFLRGWATEQPLRSPPSREKSRTVFEGVCDQQIVIS